jgi:outer membrane receptor protein involved in Fe transport
LPVSSTLAIANGAKTLKEEESLNLGLGFTYTGLDNGNLAIDFYQTKVDDRLWRTLSSYGQSQHL